jgi:hypothetical protein
MDTVILKVYGPKKFRFTNKDWFLPEIASRKYDELTETEQRSNRMYLRRFVLKTPPETTYTPQVDVLETLDKENKQVRYVMIVTFSVPKLVFGNSVQEIADNELGKVVSVLQLALSKAGVLIEMKDLLDARVSAVHFCKNIALPKDILLQDVLADLQRVDISKTVDVTTKETKNGGQILHIYSGVVERVFYDKVTDAVRPKNKRKDKGHIDYERHVIDEYGLAGSEIFRYEYRIKKTVTTKRIINAALERDAKSFVTFRDIFTEGLAQKVLLQSWRELVGRPENQLALMGPTDHFKVLQHILETAKADGKAHSLNKALVSFGIYAIIKSNGAKEFKRQIFKNWNADHPERLNKKVQQAAELTKGLPYSNGVAFVDGKLEEYKLITRQVLDNGLL